MRRGGPRVARFLARLLLSSRGREFILGDLEEMYAHRVDRDGAGAAGRRYLSDVLRSAVARVVPRIGRGGGKPPHQQRPSRAGSGFLADVRSALRTLRHEKGFAALVVLTLGLGVGSTAVVFGMVDQLLLRPLPGVHDGGRAAYLRFYRPGDPQGMGGGWGISTQDFDELRKDATLLDGVASYELNEFKVSVGAERPVGVLGLEIYGDFFEMLGVRPAAGRLLRASDIDLDSNPARTVLSQRLADKLFGSAAGAVGRMIRVNDYPVLVVGVAGGGFRGLRQPYVGDLWVPFGGLGPLLGFPSSALRHITHSYLLARPRAGVSFEAAEAQLQSVLRRLARLNGDRQSGPDLAKLEPQLYPGVTMRPSVRATTYRSLRLLAGVVALVLLIACANVANLLLFRNVTRQGSVATRRALGASSMRIAREHLVQSVVLGVLGAAAGLGVGWIISFLFRGQALMAMPAFSRLPLDHRVALFAALAAIVTVLLFGTVPAVVAGRFDLVSAMRRSEIGHTGRLATLRGALAAGQLALMLTLVVGAGLLLRTVHDLYALDLGFDAHDVQAFQLSYGRNLSASSLDALYQNVLTTVQGIPGVESAALDRYGSPVGDYFLARVAPSDAAGARGGAASIAPVTPGWFNVFHVRVMSGRAFGEDDWRMGAPARVVLTESLARGLFGSVDPLGRTVQVRLGRKPTPMEVVGVVGDIRSPVDPAHPVRTAFVTYSTWNAAMSRRAPLPSVMLLVRTVRSDPQVSAQVRSAVAAIMPNEPTPDRESLSTVARFHATDIVLSHLLVLLAALAAALSAVGLYGVIAFKVAGRRREFGIRIALGADASRIADLVFRSSVVIIAGGTLLGLGGAYVLSGVVQSQLSGVGPLEPAYYFAGAALLALVAALACWTPARRAMRVDPAETLREE